MMRQWRVMAAALMLATAGCTPGPGVAPREAATAGDAPLRYRAVDLSAYFTRAGTEGCFVLLDPRRHEIVRYNPERGARRYFPASTFKIPNSLIALETGVADGLDFTLRYDPAATPRQDWWPADWTNDQTLRTAIRDSVVWYYQELARRTGPERMRAFVERFGYGNRDISGPIDRFWLRGPLQISADEQVAFLQRFYEGKLGLSLRTMRLARELFVLRDLPAYRLSGKSGTWEVTATREFAWHVGYLERRGGVYYYALNMEGERVWEDWPPARRVELVVAILAELGVLPAAAATQAVP